MNGRKLLKRDNALELGRLKTSSRECRVIAHKKGRFLAIGAVVKGGKNKNGGTTEWQPRLKEWQRAYMRMVG
ncbi:MAG: hypothetical protein ABL921_16620 [Pirellula sp.]